MNRKSLYSLALFGASCLAAQAATVTLLDEEFTGGAAPSNTATVTWTSTTTFETYDSTGAGARDMNSTYDHDQNPGTADITIPGGYELNGAGNNATATATIVLPVDLDNAVNGVLTFYAGRRTAGGSDPTITILNQGLSVISSGNVSINADDNIWEYSNLSVDLSTTNPGENLIIRWTAGNGGNATGLQLADIQFDVQTVPEPSGAALLGLGGLAMLMRRRK